jgi:hypothetical protein
LAPKLDAADGNTGLNEQAQSQFSHHHHPCHYLVAMVIIKLYLVRTQHSIIKCMKNVIEVVPFISDED